VYTQHSSVSQINALDWKYKISHASNRKTSLAKHTSCWKHKHMVSLPFSAFKPTYLPANLPIYLSTYVPNLTQMNLVGSKHYLSKKYFNIILSTMFTSSLDVFRLKLCTYFSFPNACYMPCPYNPPWSNCRNNISLRAQIIKLIMQFPPVLC
jgi:hypothetical protein